MPEPLHAFECWLLEGLTHETFWVAIGAIVSACVAIATFRLALFTKRLAEETSATIREGQLNRAQVDSLHQEAFSPLVLVRADLLLEQTIEYEPDYERQRENPDGSLTPGQGEPYDSARFVLSGFIVNVGTGPAVSISLIVKPEGYEEQIFTVTPMGANSQQGLALSWKQEVFAVYPTVELKPFEVSIDYATIFETRGVSHQRSHSGLGKDLLIATDHRRPQPIARNV